MNNHRSPLPLLCLFACLTALALLFTACAHTPNWQTAASKSIHTSVIVADEFLQYEQAHRATLGPKITAIADDIRTKMPDLVRNARAALAAYESATSPGAKTLAQGAVDDALGQLAALQQTATVTLTAARQH